MIDANKRETLDIVTANVVHGSFRNRVYRHLIEKAFFFFGVIIPSPEFVEKKCRCMPTIPPGDEDSDEDDGKLI